MANYKKQWIAFLPYFSVLCTGAPDVKNAEPALLLYYKDLDEE